MSVAKKVAQTRWNYDAYCAIPDDGQRHEIIDGEHFVNPAPNLYHQKVSGYLYFQLFSLIEMSGLGSVLYSPIDLQLVLENGHYKGALETTSITMQAEARVTVNLNRVW